MKPLNPQSNKFAPPFWGLLILLFFTNTLKADPRIFDFYIHNPDSEAVQVKLFAGSCYEGSMPNGEVYTIPAGEKMKLGIIARIQGHGCDGENGHFRLEFTPGHTEGKEVNFYFDNSGGLWTAGGLQYPGSLNPKSGNSYTYSTYNWLIDQQSEISNAQKLELIQKYAPYVYMNAAEEYFPSTVEFAFPHLTRYLNDGQYWLKSKERLNEPSDDLDFFKGDMASAKVYAFWVEKVGGIKEITYFFYYPYNRGKKIAGTIWGNHIGDWEHLTIRLKWDCDQTPCTLSPYQVYLSQHAHGDTRPYESVKKVGDSPIVYVAWGSHAMYFETGDHNYKSIPLLGDLIDRCSQGEVFDTSQANRIEAYDYGQKIGLNNQAWPVWMSSDFTSPGTDPSNPESGGSYRWGNAERGCSFGQCRLESGPTGPISKGDVWTFEVIEK